MGKVDPEGLSEWYSWRFCHWNPPFFPSCFASSRHNLSSLRAGLSCWLWGCCQLDRLGGVYGLRWCCWPWFPMFPVRHRVKVSSPNHLSVLSDPTSLPSSSLLPFHVMSYPPSSTTSNFSLLLSPRLPTLAIQPLPHLFPPSLLPSLKPPLHLSALPRSRIIPPSAVSLFDVQAQSNQITQRSWSYHLHIIMPFHPRSTATLATQLPRLPRFRGVFNKCVVTVCIKLWWFAAQCAAQYTALRCAFQSASPQQTWFNQTEAHQNTDQCLFCAVFLVMDAKNLDTLWTRTRTSEFQLTILYVNMLSCGIMSISWVKV